MKINIRKHIFKIKKRKEEEIHFRKMSKQFPSDINESFQYKLKLISKFSNELAAKSYSFDVVISWLYEQGLTDNEARALIWTAKGKGILDIDADFNIKCMKHKL